MRKGISLTLGMAVVLMGALTAYAQQSMTKSGVDAARTQEVLGLARKAIGSEAKLKAVQSLMATAKFRRVVQGQDQSGEVELQFLLPDKYKRTETFSVMQGVEVTLVWALNGEQMWTDSHTFANGTGVAVMRAGSADPAAQAAKQKELHTDFVRQTLGLLLTPPAASGLQFSYLGEAELEGGKADVLNVTGTDGLAMQLYLDQKTHHLAVLSYKAKVANVPSAMASDSESKAKELQARAAEQQESEVRLFYSDYRNEEGLMLPHHIAKDVNGNAAEEWDIKTFKVNPPLTAQKFEKK